MTTLGFIMFGMVVYFLFQFRLNKEPFTSVGQWFKVNGLNLITYIVLGVAYVMLIDVKIDKVLAFGLGFAPNYLIDWVQSLIPKNKV